MTKSTMTYWVLVANGGRARVIETRREPYRFEEVTDRVSESQHLTNKELVSDASGRVNRSQGAGTHSMNPRSDPHENAEVEFTRRVAESLGRAHRLHRFDRLAILADPRTLGRLRRQLDADVRETLREELALDLVRLPLPKLETRVRETLGWTA